MGRQTTTEAEYKISVRLNESQYAKLVKLSEASKGSLSAALRLALSLGLDDALDRLGR